MSTQPEQLVEEARRLSDQATPGRWILSPDAHAIATDPWERWVVMDIPLAADAAFLAAARELVPALATALSECRERERKVDGWLGLADDMLTRFGDRLTPLRIRTILGDIRKARVLAAQPLSEALEAIRREHRHAMATRRDPGDSWLNGYQDDVGFLLAALSECREREGDLRRALDEVTAVALKHRDERNAAEEALRDELRGRGLNENEVEQFLGSLAAQPPSEADE